MMYHRFNRARAVTGSDFATQMSWKRGWCHPVPMALPTILLLLFTLPPSATGQRVNLAAVGKENLPDLPERSSLDAKGEKATPAEPAASISGTILDANGRVLENASVTLTSADGSAERSLLSGSSGEFDFRGLAAGSFKLKVTLQGMEPQVLSDIVLQPSEGRALPRIVMMVAGTTTDVQVVVTRTELAQEQIHAAEHQRALGILPNFYSSYIWDAEPLNAQQKFSLAFHSITDPVEFLATGVIAGVEQANKTFPGYGQGSAGYAKRYAAAYGDDVLGRLIGSAILPSLLHQDPRYFYRGTGSVRSRAYYAVTRALVTRGENGQAQPNYSRLLGSFAAGGLANLYYPHADRGIGLTLADGFVSIGGHAVDNLIREFLLRRVTPNVPEYEKGKQ